MSGHCYHCGLPIPADIDFAVEIGGTQRDMCCAGCQAVAQAIVDSGLIDYYQHRDALPESPREAMPAALQELGLFDHPDVQKSFVRPCGENEREAALILEGITCAACVWLNEQHIAKQPGVTAVNINYATRRARVRWDERQIKLSQILEAIAAIGYRAHPYDVTKSEALAQKERRAALWRLFVAGFGMMQVMMYAVPVYLADDGTMTRDIETLMRWASLVLTLPVVFYSAAPFFTRAWRDLKLYRVGMDVPVALGVGSAFAASVWATLTVSGDVYFDSVTMFVFFLLTGRFLEMLARQKAVRGVEELARVIPAFASCYTHYPIGEPEQVAVSRLVAGDVILVSPGQVIPVDGAVVDGESGVDESLLTGESRPIKKMRSAAVVGGSLNIDSPLTIRVERVGESTRLASIQRLMERAASEKPTLVTTADRIASRFVSALLVLAVVTAAYWWWVDPGQALWIFVAVLVVSCPCALSLATPAALTVATGVMSRNGVLITRGHAIETLARATHFVFDKTGTLTEGRPAVVDTRVVADITREEALALAGELERGSEHPIGRALRDAATNSGTMGQSLTSIRAITGQGMEGMRRGQQVRLGSPQFVVGSPRLPDVFADWEKSGDTLVALGEENRLLAVFRLADRARSGARETIAALKSRGIEVSILSGDAQSTVTRIAADLGIDDARGGLTPEGKHREIQTLQAGGATVAMAGDGVNDAPVLAQAHVSIAMGEGTDLALSQGDIVLLSNDPIHLVAGLDVARKSVRVIRQNLIWAFAYNIVAIPLAMTGLVTPWLAGIGMSASSLLVVLNALRLQNMDIAPNAGSS